ncbi:MAG: hypothetical protein JKY66_06535 [Spongiibacteraceae bacterium]|nr:hypothetical protein [Spongiibacteraceae bacterium]
MRLLKGRSDLHFPLIKPPGVTGALLYDYSVLIMGQVNFVLYTQKNSLISVDNISNKKFDIRTTSAHIQHFDFPIKTSAQYTSAIRMVSMGRIDGFIFVDKLVDPVIKAYALSNIRRQFYKAFDMGAVLPKGQRGNELDIKLAEGLKRLQDKGWYLPLVQGVGVSDYDDWQP